MFDNQNNLSGTNMQTIKNLDGLILPILFNCTVIYVVLENKDTSKTRQFSTIFIIVYAVKLENCCACKTVCYWQVLKFNHGGFALMDRFFHISSLIWLFLSGKLLLNLMDHTDLVRDLTFAPDGSLMLVSASRDKTLRVWDLKDDGIHMICLW